MLEVPMLQVSTIWSDVKILELCWPLKSRKLQKALKAETHADVSCWEKLWWSVHLGTTCAASFNNLKSCQIFGTVLAPEIVKSAKSQTTEKHADISCWERLCWIFHLRSTCTADLNILKNVKFWKSLDPKVVKGWKNSTVENQSDISWRAGLCWNVRFRSLKSWIEGVILCFFFILHPPSKKLTSRFPLTKSTYTGWGEAFQHCVVQIYMNFIGWVWNVANFCYQG